MRKIAWVSEKGGTGKSTCAVNTAVGLAKRGRRVLLIDCDPQSNATLVLLGGKEPEAPTLAEVLINEADAVDTIRKSVVNRLDVLPATTLLASTNAILMNEIGQDRRLRKKMEPIEGTYDYVVVDTGPARSIINVNVLNYVSELYCAVSPRFFSVAGLIQLQASVAEVVRELENQELRIAGLVVTKALNNKANRDVEAQLRATFGKLVLATVIPENAKVEEAHACYKSVLDYAPRSPGAKVFADLTAEIISHEQRAEGTGVQRGGSESAAKEGRSARTGRGGIRAAG